MDIAIVTGAETPLGLRLIERLIQHGCRVHGIGNNLSKIQFADPNFVAHAVDLTDLAALRETAQGILDREQRVDILIHAIDVTPGGAFEKLPVGNLEAVLKIGLLGPVLLTRLLLPNLLRFRGRLIQIVPANKSGTPASAVNALIEGGLRELNRSLFHGARDAGLKVTTLILRQNTALPPAQASDLQFSQSRIDPTHVARVVEQLLDEHGGNVPDEITLHPRLSPEAEAALPAEPLPLDPYNTVVLPPKDYCPPEETPIPTRQKERVERVIPYTDEELEDKIAAAVEDYESNPERYEEEPPRGRPEAAASRPGRDQNSTEDGGERRSKRRRRRGGRNRNKERDQGPEENGRPDSKAEAKRDDRPAAKPETRQRPETAPDPNAGGDPRREGRDRPTDSAPPKEKPAPQKEDRGPRPRAAAPAPAPEEGAAKPAKKKAAKKKAPAKKATKKAAKKTARKKTAKKAASAPPAESGD